MKVYTNELLVTRKQRTGFWSTLAGVVMMIGAIFVSQNPENVLIAWLISLIGLVLALFGTYHINRWARRPVAHQSIGRALEKLDSRHLLVNYVAAIPHVLLTPRGLVGIRVKRYEGPAHFNATSGKWQGKFSLGRLYMQGMTAEGLGDPVAEAEAGSSTLRAWLPTEHAAVPIATVVYFLSPTTTLGGDPAPVPIAQPDTLKKIVQEQFADEPNLPHDSVEALRGLLENAARAKGLTTAAPERRIRVKTKSKRKA